MEELSIVQLVENCLLFLREHNYSYDRIRNYQRYWKKGIVSYMQQEGIVNYSTHVGLEYKNRYIDINENSKSARDKIRAIDVLNDMLTKGAISKRRTIPIEYPLNGAIGHYMQMFLDNLQNQRRAKPTLYRHRLHLNGFLVSLYTHGVTDVNLISESDITRYIVSRKTDLPNCISTLRGVFRFWCQEGLLHNDFEDLFHTVPIVKKEKIPSFYNKEEIKKIEDSVSRANPLGKRNYAILLLASRLGLRASDIAALTFSNINWDTNTITLIMKKTCKIIELPLLTEVGNAIIDYLRHGRPKSDSKHIFLCAIAPYKEIVPFGICGAISQIIQRAPVDIKDRHHGGHSMRHSLAACMLSNGETIPTISEVLGHKKTQTTLTYLKIDLKSLLECSLPVPSVTESFYMQKGGVFYE